MSSLDIPNSLEVARQIGNTFSGPVQFLSTNQLQFGNTPSAAMFYDGTNFVIDPAIAGAGFVDISGNARVVSLGIGGVSPNTVQVVAGGGISSATYTSIFSSSLTHTGSGTSLRALAFTVNGAGTATQPAILNFCISNLAANVTTVGGTSNLNITGFQGTAGLTTAAQTVGAGQTKNVTMVGVTGSLSASALAHNGTGGTLAFFRTSVLAPAPGALSALAGGATDTSWALRVEGDAQFNDNIPVIFGGTSTVKATNRMTWVSASSVLRTEIGAATFWDMSSTTLTLSDAKNIAVNATTGTKIGTATTQKIGLWNATPVVQHSTTGQTAGFTANVSTPVLVDSTFTGGSGTNAYTIGDIVLALKNCGVVAA